MNTLVANQKAALTRQRQRAFTLVEMLAVIAVAVSAVPTAYTGGSGIFVIAVGSLVYLEVRRAGARRQLALAATAMSGSLGVVLSLSRSLI